MVQNLFQDVIRVSLTTSAVITVLLLLFPLIHKNYTTKWRYFVWLILAVRLLIPFSPSFPQAPIEITPVSQNIEFKVPVQKSADSAPYVSQKVVQQAEKPLAASSESSSPASRTVTLNEILSMVWVLGIALFMIYHFIGYFIFKESILRFSKPIEDKHTVALWLEIKKEMKISHNIRMMVCKKAQSPMMTGFFKPLLLLPDLDYSDADLKVILKHELIHYRSRDIWYKLLMVCANAVHWFNPLVYLMTAASNRDIEMACDSELIKDSDSVFRKQYSETILSAIHNGDQRQMAFSTHFYGGKKIMKERFANIFDMNEKRKGIFALCAIIIVIGIAGASVAYGVDGSKAGKAIDNIALLNAGNSYELIDGKFVISYGAERFAVVPLTPDTDDQAAYFEDKAVYISDEVTAVAYGGHNNNYSGEVPPVSILISGDKGQTWSTYTVTDTTIDYETKYIGFTSKDDGWLLLAGGVAMGRQNNRIFQTSDGGKSWHEIGNTSDTYARVATGAGFADKSIGFVSFRYDSDINPIVYRTQNKGKTWTKCSLEIPDTFKGITTYAAALSPVFNGANGVLPVTFRNSGFDSSGNPVDVTVRYETSDYGKTWTFNEKYNLALIWADAWSTRDGRARYQIMDSKMQSDFRSQQEKVNGDSNSFATRWSSPWVVKYDVTLEGDQAVVTYWYMDSTASTYKGVERLSFGNESGRVVVTDSKTEVDMEEYVDTSGWESVDTGLYTFSIPGAWDAQAFTDGTVSFTFAPSGEKLGTLSTLGYDSSLPLSQFEGNHAETLSSKTLEGYKYPATKVIIRRTQPAAANDDSYVDETHIYLIPQNSKYAYDLYFDSALVNQKSDEVAKSIVINTNRVQIQHNANQWAEAVKNRDGKAQYNLMSQDLQKRVHNDFQERNWVTGQSSPWVDGFTVKPGDNTATVTYTYMTSDGFAGYYLQTLTFSKGNGQYMISNFTDPRQANGQNQGTVIAYLDDGSTWLSADNLYEGMFSDMTLSIDGKTKRFPWKTYGEPAFLPELSYADVDGDGQNELIVILCESEGTGHLVEEIHVLNPEDFSEITVQSPLVALENRVVSKIDESGVKITIDNQSALVFPEKEITAKVAEKERWFGNLATGSIVDYSMQGNDVVVRVAAQISPAGFLGDFNLTYEYKDNQLKVSGISFSAGYEK